MAEGDYLAAGAVVELIKSIIRDELSKRDQIFVGTVQQRNDADDTYSIYIDTDLSNGRPTVMRNIPNESKHIYRTGDHVYVMKVRGQVAQAFIIGSMGARGTSINLSMADINRRLDTLDGVLTQAGIKAPAFRVRPLTYNNGQHDCWAFEISWEGKYMFNSFLNVRYTTYSGGSQTKSSFAVGYVAQGTVDNNSGVLDLGPSSYLYVTSSSSNAINLGQGDIASANIGYGSASQNFVVHTNLRASNVTIMGAQAETFDGVSLMDVGFAIVKES